jgi:hypothetical protein
MPSSRNHQQSHGLGQIDEQLEAQVKAAASIQGQSETDREALQAARREQSELDEIIDD